MGIAAFLELLGAPLGASLGVALGVMVAAVVGFWRLKSRETWWRVVVPVALAAGFVAGFATKLEFPRRYDAELWKWTVVTAAAAGVLLAIGAALPRWGEWIVWAVLGGFATWMTQFRIPSAMVFATAYPRLSRWCGEVWQVPSDKVVYAVVLGVGLALYFAAVWPVVRDARLWAVPAAVLLPCGFAGAGMLMPFDPVTGQLLVMVTALVGLAGAVGLLGGIGRLRPLRVMASGGAAFLAVMMGVLVAVSSFYDVGDSYPMEVLKSFWLLGAAPLAMGVVWVPWLRRRPWRCALAGFLVAAALVVPAVMIALKNAPPMDG